MLDGDKESSARDRSVFHSFGVGAADRLFAKRTIRVVHRLAIHERGLFGSSVLLSVLQISQRSKSGGSFSERMILKEFSGQRGQQSQKCHNPLMSRRYSIGIQTRTHTKPVVVLVPRGIAPEQMIGQSLRSSTESQTALECQVFDTPRGCGLRPSPADNCSLFLVLMRDIRGDSALPDAIVKQISGHLRPAAQLATTRIIENL